MIKSICATLVACIVLGVTLLLLSCGAFKATSSPGVSSPVVVVATLTEGVTTTPAKPSPISITATRTPPTLPTITLTVSELPTDLATQTVSDISDPSANIIELLSRSLDGIASNGPSADPSLSADGRFVAFESQASNLVAGDTNNQQDIFIYDRQRGSTERVSVASDGTEANSFNLQASISADGRFIAFVSGATNLAPGDESDGCGGYCTDLFIYDRQAKELSRIPRPRATLGHSHSVLEPSLSAEGRFVAFEFAIDSNAPEIFVFDRQTNETELVSVASDGTPANSSSVGPTISADGRFVSFLSYATNLTAGGVQGAFVRDRQTRTTEWIGLGNVPTISADGRWVAFLYDGIVLYDRHTGRDATVVGSSQITGEGMYDRLSLSGDGLRLASSELRLRAGGSEVLEGLFVYDQSTNQTLPISVATDGTLVEAGGYNVAVSADGRFVAFASSSNRFVPDDVNEATDIFLVDLSQLLPDD